MSLSFLILGKPVPLGKRRGSSAKAGQTYVLEFLGPSGCVWASYMVLHDNSMIFTFVCFFDIFLHFGM